MTRRLLLLLAAAALAGGCASPSDGPSLVVGATAADRQNLLLANVYAAGLRYYGTAATVRTDDDALASLDAGTVGVTAGFTGRLLRRFIPDSAARSPAGVYRAMVGALPEGVAAADYAVAAEDKPALAVAAATADRWGSRELLALVSNCASVRLGALEGATVPESVGDCAPPPARLFPNASAMFGALGDGAVTAVWTSTADPAVPEDAVVLADRKPALVTAENVVALYRRNELGTLQLRAINELAGVLDTAALRDMLGRVDRGADPQKVAEEWLAANPLGR